jgi:putative phosphoribosyl transferase
MKRAVEIPVDDQYLSGDLFLPDSATGIVVFSHGSGSSRFSPRNAFVAQQMHKRGFGTLLLDLLSPAEDQDYESRFNIDLLTRRLEETTRWLTTQPVVRNLPVAYFGASTGAASALRAAASLGTAVKAVVSRGGRPDLALAALSDVSSPTLLIVGSQDSTVLELNQQAFEAIRAEKELKLVPQATHLFEEPGALETVADMAGEWYEKYLAGTQHSRK